MTRPRSWSGNGLALLKTSLEAVIRWRYNALHEPDITDEHSPRSHFSFDTDRAQVRLAILAFQESQEVHAGAVADLSDSAGLPEDDLSRRD